MRLLDGPPPFLQIARGTRSDEVGPQMLAAFMLRDHVVDRQTASIRTAVLARVTIPSEDLSLAQANPWAGPFHHVPQPNNRRPWVILPDRMNDAASIQQHLRLPCKDEPYRPSCGADV